MLIYRFIIFIYLFKNLELKEIKSYNNFFIKKQINTNNDILFFYNSIYHQIFSLNNNNTNITNNTNNTNSNKSVISKIKNADQIFVTYYILSFLILFTGIFVILYGGYFYQLGLITHFTLLSFNVLVLLLPQLLDTYPFLFLFCFISGILIYLSLITNDIKSIKYKIQKIIYGLTLGCFIHKTIFFYNNLEDTNTNNLIYIITFCISNIVFGIIGFFLPDLFTFLFCSTISGSYYFISSLNSIIDIENNKKEIFPTIFIIQIIIIILFTIYQIYHLRYKKNEDPYFSTIEKYEDNDDLKKTYKSQLSESNQVNDTKNEFENQTALTNLTNGKIYDEDEEEDEIDDKDDS